MGKHYSGGCSGPGGQRPLHRGHKDSNASVPDCSQSSVTLKQGDSQLHGLFRSSMNLHLFSQSFPSPAPGTPTDTAPASEFVPHEKQGPQRVIATSLNWEDLCGTGEVDIAGGPGGCWDTTGLQKPKPETGCAAVRPRAHGTSRGPWQEPPHGPGAP